MKYVEYLDDNILRGLIKKILDLGIAKKISAINDFQINVIDPFAALFEAALSELDHQSWKQAEIIRQCQKTLTNHLGDLHQKILGNFSGWRDLSKGNLIDLVCDNRKIIAEIKNKYNTVTGGKLSDQYYSLERLILPKTSQYRSYTAYFVNIIPNKPQRFDSPFQPSNKETGKKCPENQKIRVIDGASFYTLVTGRENALAEFYDALPLIIEDIFRKDYEKPSFTIQDKDVFKQYFTEAYAVKTEKITSQ